MFAVFYCSVCYITTVEHGLFFCSAIFNYHQRKKACEFEITDDWKHFFTSEYNYIFRAIPYSLPITVGILVNTLSVVSNCVLMGTEIKLVYFFLQYANFCMTICWNYMDVFIIMVSIGLSTRFNQINQRLQAIRGQVSAEFLRITSLFFSSSPFCFQ